MSTMDDNENAVLEGTAGHDGDVPEDSPENGPWGPVLLFFFVGLAISLIVGWGIFPQLLYSKKEQPVDFNHKLHVEEVENGCESCHYFRADGSFSGIPKISDCIECHEDTMGESEAEHVFVTEYVHKGREVPWMVYAKQPDCVFFSHAAHVKMGEISCETCHGHIGESDHARAYEENRITGYSRDIWGERISGFKKETWERMKMDDCAGCHEEMTGRITSVQTQYDACFVCHK